jgi:Zn-dependent membrane protease YugP
VQFGSSLAWILLIGGFVLASAGSRLGPPLLIGGLICFGLALVFSLVTLPVEIKRLPRALALISRRGILQGEENDAASEVLRAAAYKYVAAVVVAALQFLYYALQVLPLLGGRRD